MQMYGLKSQPVVFAAACLLFSSVAAAAQEPEFTLEPVIVAAARYHEAEIRPGHYSLEESELAAANYENALDALLELPGISLTSRGASGGMNAYSKVLLNGSDRYVVVVDGVRANWNGSSYNDFDFSVLPAELLSSVEILPAAEGAVYGNAAKGGVIRITTKKAAEGVRTSLQVETGSYGRERESLLQLGQSGDWSWSVYGEKSLLGDYKSARQRIESHENTEKADLKLTRTWKSADLTLRYSAFSGNYRSKIFNYKRIEQPDKTYIKEKNIFMVDGRKTESNFALEYNRELSAAARNQFGVYRRDSEAAYDDAPNVARPWLLDLRTQGFFDRYTNDWHSKNTLTAGVEYYQEQVLGYQDLQSKYSDRKLISRAAYLQNEWRLDDSFKATGSLRQDDHSYAGSKLSPALALAYRPTERLFYTLSYTEYFAPPKQLELFAPYGDAVLQPEEGKVGEAGVAYMLDASLTLKASVFHRDATNVIGFRHLSPVEVQYANIAREKADGFTVSADKRLSDSWRLSVAYTRAKLDIEKEADTSAQGATLPRGEWLCSLAYDRDPYSAVLEGRGVIDQANGRGEGLYANNTYWVWNLSLNYKADRNTKLYFKVNNLLDQFYSRWDNDTEGFLAPEEWYAEPGRNYQLGVQYTF